MCSDSLRGDCGDSELKTRAKGDLRWAGRDSINDLGESSEGCVVRVFLERKCRTPTNRLRLVSY
jgi:hypothetical protein